MQPLPIDEPLKTFFAVQLLPKEAAPTVAKILLQTASQKTIYFRRLEVLDTITVGATALIRFRSDLKDSSSIIDELHSAGRAVISFEAGDYVLRLSGGRTGKISHTLMHAEPKLGQSRMYRGTKIKRWEAQFASV